MISTPQKSMTPVPKNYMNRQHMQKQLFDSLDSIIHYQKRYMKFKIKHIIEFIDSIESMNGKTTAIHQRFSDLTSQGNRSQHQLKQAIDIIKTDISKDEYRIDTISQITQNKIRFAFCKYTDKFTNMNKDLQERAERLIRNSL